jgi:hypothetical protein
MTPAKNPEAYQALANWLNISTGRGSYGAMTRFAPAMQAVFFSPRLIAARFQTLNPMTYARMPKPIRIMALQDVFKFVGATTALLGVAKMGGAQVNLNPTATDFGKIKMGDTRIDPWGGFVQLVRPIAQLSMGYRTGQQGEKVLFNAKKFPYESRADVVTRFAESKLNPWVGMLWDAMKGRTFSGEELKFSTEAAQHLTPLYIQDAVEAAQKEGFLKGMGLAAPGFYGYGVQTYQPKKKGLGVSMQGMGTPITQ